MTRVSVFIDYQNVYHCAREAFGDPLTDPPTFGHVRPHRLGLLLKQLGEKVDPARELVAVTVYRGKPGTKSHPRLQSAFARQVAAWMTLPWAGREWRVRPRRDGLQARVLGRSVRPLAGFAGPGRCRWEG